MTREEAIKHLLHDWYINLGCDFAVKPGRLDDFLAAIDVALAALRGPTREMVERMRGEWIAKHYVDGVLEGTNFDECTKCGYQRVFENPELKTVYMFCPHCGAPMTDEAVEMVMERLEALKDGSTTD